MSISISRRLASLVIISIVLLSCSKEQQSSPLVAQVDNTKLTLDDVHNQLGIYESESVSNDHVQSFVNRWIDNEVIFQSALAEKIDRLPQIQNELERLRRDLIIGYYVDSKLNKAPAFLDEDIVTYYQQNREDFVRDTAEYRYLFLICINSEIARAVKVELAEGKGFNEIVAERYPDEVLNNKWDSGLVRLEEVIQPLQKNIGRRKAGGFYGPVASQEQHVVYQLVEKHDPGSLRELPGVRHLIIQRLKERWYRESYQELMLSLKGSKKINLNFDILDKNSATN